MKERVWALCEVAKWIGIDAMLAQVKDEEVYDLLKYTNMFFINTNGLNQEREMEAWGYQQEAAELGWNNVTALNDYLHEKMFK